MNNKPTLGGYLELLLKALVSVTLLIFMGVGCAIVVLGVPFTISLICVLALVGAGAFVFSWNYVWIGTVSLLLLFAMSL